MVLMVSQLFYTYGFDKQLINIADI